MQETELTLSCLNTVQTPLISNHWQKQHSRRVESSKGEHKAQFLDSRRSSKKFELEHFYSETTILNPLQTFKPSSLTVRITCHQEHE